VLSLLEEEDDQDDFHKLLLVEKVRVLLLLGPSLLYFFALLLYSYDRWMMVSEAEVVNNKLPQVDSDPVMADDDRDRYEYTV
jgi:hypothetical protein